MGSGSCNSAVHGLLTAARPVFTTLSHQPAAALLPTSPHRRGRRRHAMLRLRSSILAHLLSSPSTSPGTSVHRRLLSSAAPRISPNPSFAAEDYLVGTCGLTRAQALKASGKISHLKSPTNPDAVLAFLAGLGLSGADVAAVVAKDPKFLCARVDRTLEPIVVELTGLGVSRSEVARLFSLAPGYMRCTTVVSSVHHCLGLFGSSEKLLRVIKSCTNILGSNLEKVVKPNFAFLRECGIDACDFAKLCITVPWMPGTNPERVRAMVARAEALGVPRGSGMFRQALQTVAFLSDQKIPVKLAYLKNTFRWSDAEVGIAVCKDPILLVRSNDTLQRKSEFLISEVGLEPAYIAHRPVMLGLSLEGRLRPRYYVMRFLKENGLIDRDRSYYSLLNPAEKVFVENFIRPHKEAAPHLAEDYATICRGQVPARFRFTSTKSDKAFEASHFGR